MDIIYYKINLNMSSENSEEYLNTSDSDWEDKLEIKIIEQDKNITAAIIDWDNTLFPTDYFTILQVNYKTIFSEESSIEDNGAYLLHELQSLEEVSLFFCEKLILKYFF
jgi:hypothetical protein